jgi:heme/copper-type cytochrome/quinol oxidase subunit 2
VHPGVIIILLLIVGVLIYSAIQARRPRGNRRAPSDVELQVVIKRPIYACLFALFLVSIFAYFLYEAYFGYGRDFPSAALFPRVIGIPGLALALVVLGLETRKLAGQAIGVATAAPEIRLAQHRTLIMLGWLALFFIVIWLLGFIAAAPVMTFLYLKIGAREKWRTSILLALLSWLFFYGLFDWAIQLPFPAGALYGWL